MYWTHFEEKGTFWHFEKIHVYFVRASLWVPCWTNLGLIKVEPLWCLPLNYLHFWRWRHLIPWPVPSNLLLIRITSSGIRASALDTGSILFNIFSLHPVFFFRFCCFSFLLFFVLVVFHSYCFSFLFFVLVVFVPVFILVFIFIFYLFYSISFLCLLVVDALFVPCYIQILFCSSRILCGTNSACWMNLGFWSNCLLNKYIGWTSGIVKSALYIKKESSCRKFEKYWMFDLWTRIWGS